MYAAMTAKHLMASFSASDTHQVQVVRKVNIGDATVVTIPHGVSMRNPPYSWKASYVQTVLTDLHGWIGATANDHFERMRSLQEELKTLCKSLAEKGELNAWLEKKLTDATIELNQLRSTKTPPATAIRDVIGRNQETGEVSIWRFHRTLHRYSPYVPLLSQRGLYLAGRLLVPSSGTRPGHGWYLFSLSRHVGTR